jgi:hypothetical protein
MGLGEAMTNRFYTNDSTKWIGPTHIGPGPADNQAKRIVKFVYDGPAGSPVAAAREAYSNALAVVDDLRAMREQVTATGKYLPLGISEALAKHAVENNLPKLRQARAAIDKIKTDISERKSKLAPTRPDPADVRGESQRREMRQRLASMTPAQRTDFVNKNRHNPDLIAAIIDAPAIYSGVDELTHRNLITEQVQREHKETIAELDDLAEAVNITDKVVSLSRDELREIIGVDRNTFEKIASVAESNAGKLPFRVDREVVDGNVVEIARVLDMQTKSWRRATPEESMKSQQGAAA